MTSISLLSLTIFLPLLGVLFILLLCPGRSSVSEKRAKNLAMGFSLLTLVFSLVLWKGFDPHNAGFQFEEFINWLPQYGISYHIGVDGISLPFVLLSAFLTPLALMASWNSIQQRIKEYMVAFLILETLMIGMFCALDFVLFYIFFEGVLIPMFLIIAVWGGPRRTYAAFKFFLYTLLGSVLMLLAGLALYSRAGTTDVPSLMSLALSPALQVWLWLAFFVSFAVKIPMWPLHTWLPDAHVEAPTAGSVILAGVLLKMGGYGFLRFSIPLFPVATHMFAPWIYALSIIAIIYTSLVALAQEDMKKLIAYSSVAHMGFVTLGLFALTLQSVQGAMFQMISHGLISGGLFLAVGVLYDRLHTREIKRYGGVATVMPKFAVAFMFLTLGSVGLPGTSGFVGEFLSLLGTFEANKAVAALAALGIILGAAYMLWLTRQILFGKVSYADVQVMPDVSWREGLIFVPVVVLILLLGIYPRPLLKMTEASVQNLLNVSTQKISKDLSASTISLPENNP